MTRRRKRLLVVDASVVRSAGETDHPVSSSCRCCLEEILHICHRVAVTHEIKIEWDRHISRYSRKWRRSMAARKKPLESVTPVEISFDADEYPEATRSRIEKDLCLLEAAFAADNIIVTRDMTLKSDLMQQSDGEKLVQSIKWINPVTDDLNVLYEL